MRREGWHAIRVLTALVLCTWQVSAWAQSGGSLPVLVGSGSNGTSFSVPIQTLLFFTALSFLPAILLMMTGFTRIVIVLSLLRQALGTQSAPPNQVIIGLSLFLTFFVMGPTLDKVYQDAYLPYTQNTISFEQAVERAEAPMRGFMLKQTRQSDFALFARLAKLDPAVTAETAPMRVLIPAFAVGRSQGLMYALYRLRQAGAIPDMPIVLDSPMAISATEVYDRHHEEHRLSADEVQGIRDMTRFVRTVDESKALLKQRYPMVIIAGSGMVTGGRILHHLAYYGQHSRNTVVLSGFQAGGTRGASLAAGATSLKMFGEYVPIRAEVAQVEGLSAHGDQADLLHWLGALGQAPQQVFVTHGEPQSADTLRLQIKEKLGWKARVPDYRETFKLDET